jgi:hypothetical protein
MPSSILVVVPAWALGSTAVSGSALSQSSAPTWWMRFSVSTKASGVGASPRATPGVFARRREAAVGGGEVAIEHGAERRRLVEPAADRVCVGGRHVLDCPRGDAEFHSFCRVL